MVPTKVTRPLWLYRRAVYYINYIRTRMKKLKTKLEKGEGTQNQLEEVEDMAELNDRYTVTYRIPRILSSLIIIRHH